MDQYHPALNHDTSRTLADVLMQATISMLSFLLDFVQVSRPGWWLVSLWLYMAPCKYDNDDQHNVIDWLGLAVVVLPINVMVYGINDASDLSNDLSNDRKGNFVFGPKGWSQDRLRRVLMPGLGCILLAMLYWGSPNQLSQYMTWYAMGILVNYLYNFYSFPLKLLLVLVGYGAVTILSYWRHNDGAQGLGIRYDEDTEKWYMGGCNQEYWTHLMLLLIRSQLWTELLDYEPDRSSQKWTTLSRLPTKALAQQVVLAVLLIESIWCYLQYQQRGSDWFTLLAFSCMGVLLFITLEYVLPQSSLHTKNAAPVVDLVWLAIMQNAGGIFLLYDCWTRGIFVR